jgi:hypothetical protein
VTENEEIDRLRAELADMATLAHDNAGKLLDAEDRIASLNQACANWEHSHKFGQQCAREVGTLRALLDSEREASDVFFGRMMVAEVDLAAARDLIDKLRLDRDAARSNCADAQAAWLVEVNKVARVREVLTYPDEQGYDFSCFYYDVRAAIEGNQP